MSFATVRRDIEKRMVDNWAVTEIAMDNVEFTPPNNTEWVGFRIYEETTERVNIGSTGVHRANGTIVAEIHGPKNTGTGKLRGYADDIGAIFRDVKFNGITCRSVSVTNSGEVDGWYRISVAIPFYWDGTYPSG